MAKMATTATATTATATAYARYRRVARWGCATQMAIDENQKQVPPCNVSSHFRGRGEGVARCLLPFVFGVWVRYAPGCRQQPQQQLQTANAETLSNASKTLQMQHERTIGFINTSILIKLAVSTAPDMPCRTLTPSTGHLHR